MSYTNQYLVSLNPNISPYTANYGSASIAYPPLRNQNLEEQTSNLVGTPLIPLIQQKITFVSGTSSSNFDIRNVNTLTYNPLIDEIKNYILREVNDIVPSTELKSRLKRYEHKYGMSSDEFYSKWIDGKISSNAELYDWLNLYLFFR